MRTLQEALVRAIHWSSEGVVMSALEMARELERKRRAILATASEDALQRAIEAFKELRELVNEQIKTIQVPPPRA